jgi:imidazolonepropionase-like amidohydrolase
LIFRKQKGDFSVSETVAITHVKVFDGHALTDECTVIIANGVISPSTPPTNTIDGQHGTLLPGFIDSHVHLTNLSELQQGTQWGCTTMLDMGSPSMKLTDSLRHRNGLADIRGAGSPACALGGWQTRMGFPASSEVHGPTDAERFVADRVSEGADYIKVVIEGAGRSGIATLDVPTIAAIVEATHKAGLKVIAHISTFSAATYAAEAGVDVLTHAPLDKDIDEHLLASLVTQGIVSIPTLMMMQAMTRMAGRAGRIATHEAADIDFVHARSSVTALHRAGIKILAGTDSNMAPASPAQIHHGESFHDELRLLVEAGLTPSEALRSATVEPAQFFGFTDRGVIEAGRRADLLLIDGDPTQDITCTRAIRGVWVAGDRVR